jgi:alkaline phosphatase D
VVGSCCHFSLVGINRADDAAFLTIRQQWEKGIAEDDFLMMLGDQIYGDHRSGKSPLSLIPAYRAALLFLPIKNKLKLTFKHYLTHYRKAFKKVNKRKVMASVPTYMTFDDHEVHNDWGSERFLQEPADYDVLKNALKAYNIYQVTHPSIQPPPLNQIKYGHALPDARYYYEFSHGRCDFFVLDARYEKDANQEPKQMISKSQMAALKTFLDRGTNRVKFIASSIPVFPDANLHWLNQILDNSPEDRWEGYVDERLEVLEHIRANTNQNINPNVFFLSGDVHCSFAYSLSHVTDNNFKVHQITSSAFNWGVGLNDMHFDRNTPLKGTAEKYVPKHLTGDVVTQDNFIRIKVLTNKLKLVIYHAKTGKAMRELQIDLV